MKSLQRYLSVFVVFALLLGAFSIPAAAADKQEYKFTLGFNDSFGNGKAQTVYSGDSYTAGWDSAITVSTTTNLHPYITIECSDGSLIAKKDKEVTFSINNIGMMIVLLYDDMEHIYNMKKFDSANLVLYYTDGTIKTISATDFITFDSSTNMYTFSGKFTPTKDVNKVKLMFEYNIYNRMGSGVVGTILENNIIDVVNVGATFSVQSEEAGLLTGLLNWVKDIFTVITDIFAFVSDIFDAIIELPQKIWEFIEEGLKNLFIPDAEYISDYKDSWDSLLSDRFGAVYQATGVIVDFWESISYSDTTNTIYMPKADLSSVGIPFSFGGYDVKVIPDGFGTIVEVVKKIISISCVFMFVNALRKRYDEVMGVEQ